MTITQFNMNREFNEKETQLRFCIFKTQISKDNRLDQMYWSNV